MGSERYQIKPGRLKQARKQRVKAIAVLLAISSTAALAVAFLIDRAGADFDQTGDTPHLDYEGYGNWSFALSGGTIEQRSHDAKAIVEDSVPDCRELTQQLRRVADDFATAIEGSRYPGDDAGPAPYDLVVPAFYKCGRTVVVSAINAGRDLRDLGVTEDRIDSLGAYSSK